ncbi:MAG TPA: TonB-dependent receptor [Flavitalea sp.]|nr:TonB-dependent receptor [Flavitalea sp.]
MLSSVFSMSRLMPRAISPKLIRILKLSGVFLLATCLQVSARSYAQNISLNLKRASLEKVFREIEKQSPYSFVYTKDLVENCKPVTLRLVNADIEEVLRSSFSGQPVTYKRIGAVIIVNTRNRKEQYNTLEAEAKAAILATIRGRVINAENKEPVVASVIVKGTSRGTTTNEQGYFEFANLADNDNIILEISSVGYQTQTLRVDKNAATEINILLVPEILAMAETVVIGYGKQKKTHLTGSVAAVDAKFLENRPITNSSQALQGVQGLYVNQVGGQPGADNATIRIRGIGTLNNNNPLVLVDGIEFNMSDVNPNDIESISVLKDASASIYGNRAANGVIIITTKTGKTGKLKVELNSYTGWQKATYLPDAVTNSVQWMESRNQAAINDGQPPVFSEAQLNEYRNGSDPDIYPNTDWYDIIFSTAPMQSHNIRLSGGAEKSNYSMSLGYLDQDGVHLNTGAKRYYLNSNVTYKRSDRLQFGAIVNASYTASYEPVGGPSSFMDNVARALPIHPAVLSDGRYGDTWLVTPGHNLFRNPLARALEGEQTQKNQRALINLFGEYVFPLDIKYKINVGANKNDVYGSRFIPEVYIYNPKEPDVARVLRYTPSARGVERTNGNNLNTSFFQTLNWEKKIKKSHDVNLLLGFSMESFYNSNISAYIEGFLGNELTELDAGTINKDVGGTSSKSQLMSYFGRANYSFSDKYLVEADFRYDGSSRFATGNRWGFFPAFSVGWRIDKEAFMQNLSAVNNLKLRASWGKLGNQNIPLFSYLNNIDINQGTTFNNAIVGGSAVIALSDPNISWETTAIANLGLDAGFFNNRLGVTVDVFDKRTTGILAPINIPAQIGNLAGPITNLYGMSNKGVEIGGSYQNSLGNLRYNVGANITYVKNNIDFLNSEIQYATNRYGNISVIKEGSSVNAWYLYESLGIFQSADEIQKHAFQDPTTAPGDIKYRDLNEDGKIDDKDMRVLGRSTPKYTYSFNLDLGYKGFDLKAFFQGVEGIDIYPWQNLAFGNYNGAGITKDQLTNSWTPDNPGAKYPRLFEPFRGPAINARNSSFWLQDASYLRLKNLQLGYNIPRRLTDRINASQVRVYINAQNYLTLSKFKLADPEKDILRQNIYDYPTTKILTVGANIIF